MFSRYSVFSRLAITFVLALVLVLVLTAIAFAAPPGGITGKDAIGPVSNSPPGFTPAPASILNLGFVFATDQVIEQFAPAIGHGTIYAAKANTPLPSQASPWVMIATYAIGALTLGLAGYCLRKQADHNKGLFCLSTSFLANTARHGDNTDEEWERVKPYGIAFSGTRGSTKLLAPTGIYG